MKKNMKKVFGVVFGAVVLFSGYVFADTVELSAALNIVRCELRDDENGICLISNPFQKNIQIELKKQIGTYYHEIWAGTWSEIAEKDGVSFVAEIRVQKNIFDAGEITYTVVGSLALNTSGVKPVPSQVSIWTSSLDKLNSLSLTGEPVVGTNETAQHYKYTPSLFIGPKQFKP